MKQVIKLEIVISIITIAIVLPLAITANISHSGDNMINWNNASRAITFDLNKGQTVTGWLNYTGEKHGAWFLIGDPNGNEIGSRTSEGNFGTYSFIATADGQYFIDISNENAFGDYLEYSYSISAPPFLGIDRVVLIGMVITIGAVLALTIAIFGFKNKKLGH
jgi:hypothetical protein